MPYNPVIADELIKAMRDGAGSVRAILEADREFYPSRGTIWQWRQDNPEFAARYQAARLAQVDGMIDDVIHLPDNAHKLEDKEAGFVGMRIRTRQWAIEKMDPKNYGPAINHEHSATVVHQHMDLFQTRSRSRSPSSAPSAACRGTNTARPRRSLTASGCSRPNSRSGRGPEPGGPRRAGDRG